MRNMLLAAVVAATLSIGTQASASPAPLKEAPVVATPDVDVVAARRGPIRNILRGLIEMERRKNAWLRRTFS